MARAERHAHLRQQHRQPTCVLESPAGGRRRALHDLRCVDCGYTAIPNCATDVVAVQAHRIRLHTRQALMHSIGRSMRSHTRSHTASQVAPDSARHGLHCLRCNHHWRSILSARTNGHRVLIAFIHRRAPSLCSAHARVCTACNACFCMTAGSAHAGRRSLPSRRWAAALRCAATERLRFQFVLCDACCTG